MEISKIIRKEYYDKNIITDIDDLIENIPRIEKLFRNSKEYKNYIASIREGLQLQHCSYFSDKDFTDVSLELHHEFPRLYDIVLIVGSKMILDLKEDEFLTVFDIVRSVLEFHMKDYPTVIMLSKTIHELYHSDQYSIPRDTDSIHLGNYKSFIEEYKEYLNDSDINKLKYFLNDSQSKDLEKLWQDQKIHLEKKV